MRATLASTVLLEDEIRRLSLEEFFKLGELGILDEDERVELIDGVLLTVTSPSEAHSRPAAWLLRHFVLAYEDLEVRGQGGVKVGRSYLEPDLAVIDPATLPADLSEYGVRAALLVIEVSVTSQRRDRVKALLYAQAGVPEYWIVDIPARTVVVYTEPSDDGYAREDTYAFGARIQPQIGGPEVNTAEIPGV